MKNIIDSIGASIYWKDLSVKYLGCNEYMAQITGMNPDQIIGKTDYCFSWKAQADKLRAIDLLVATNRKKYEIAETVMGKDGVYRMFLSSKSPLFDKSGEIIGVSSCIP